jgi:RNA polymerase sigma factor (sigma-70 family)
MKNYQDSDYALNKHSEGIVYRFADEIIEVTLADFLAENPGKTEVDFRKLKAFSDGDYRDQDRSGYRQTWKNSLLDGLDETEQCAAPSPEEILIDEPEKAELRQRQVEIAKRALDRLTEVQRRRYLLHVLKGLTLRQIAEIEGVNHSKIQKSIGEAEKKIKKFLQSA